MKGCILAAPMTGSGKTTVTLALLATLRRLGFEVQPFKVGPDFIDIGLHELAAGRPSHNLDGWMLSRERNRELFASATRGADFAIVEGVMGLFDGYDGTSEAGSTAQMAKWLGLPLILVIDASAMARSAAAVIHGMRTFDPDLSIAGVILNRVAGEGHYRMIADAVKDLPILGWIPSDPALELPERHLGLFTAQESEVKTRIESIAEFMETNPETRRILECLPTPLDLLPKGKPEVHSKPANPSAPITVALAHDAAFSFYYRANRMELESAGARIIEFSPIRDPEMPPETQFLYIGGGYPELYRRELESNTSMQQSVRRYIEGGGRVYAECGGLMYLAQSIEDSKMVGILPARIQMTNRPVNFGYSEVVTQERSILGPAGTRARGHQFHYSSFEHEPANPVYRVTQGAREYPEGFILPNGIASYVHLHFLSNPAIARSMLQF